MFFSTGPDLGVEDQPCKSWCLAHLFQPVFYQTFDFFLNLLKCLVDDFLGYFFDRHGSVRHRRLVFELDLAVEGFEDQRLVGAVGGDTDEFAGGEGGDLASRQGHSEDQRHFMENLLYFPNRLARGKDL